MTQEFLRDSSMEEATKQFDQELREYVELVNSIDNVDKLNEMEQFYIKKYGSKELHLYRLLCTTTAKEKIPLQQ